MSFLQYDQIETVAIPIVFTAQSTAQVNFDFPFIPSAVLFSIQCDDNNSGATVELINFYCKGRLLGSTYSNTMVSGMSEPILHKPIAGDKSINYNRETVSLYGVNGAPYSLTASVVIICRLYR